MTTKKKKRRRKKLPKTSSSRLLPARAVRTWKTGHYFMAVAWFASGCKFIRQVLVGSGHFPVLLRECGLRTRGRFSCSRCPAARLEIWTRQELLFWQLVFRCLDCLRSTGFASIGRRLRENGRVFSTLGLVQRWIHVPASVREFYFHEPCASGAHCSSLRRLRSTTGR